MRTVQAENGKAIIRFEYDPGAVDRVKSIPGRRWNADEKYWWVIVTPEVQPHLLELRDNFGFNVDPSFQLPKETFRGENLLDTEWNPLEGELKENLYPYQRAGVEWALKRIARSEGKDANWYLQTNKRTSEKNDDLFGNREDQTNKGESKEIPEREISKYLSEDKSFRGNEDSNVESYNQKKAFDGNKKNETEFQRGKWGSPNGNNPKSHSSDGDYRIDSGASGENEKRTGDANFLQTGFRKFGNEDRIRDRREIPSTNEKEDGGRKKNKSTRSNGVGNNPDEQRRGFIIADEPGVGKTAQAISIAKLSDGLPALVVCPASLKINWAREIERWTGERATIMGKGPQDYWFGTGNWMIVNYDILDRFEFPEFKTIIADEAHYLKNGKTKRSELFKELSKRAARVIMLTGTPVLSRPSEIVNLLTILGYIEKFGGWWRFMTRYCGAFRGKFGIVAKGATNIAELSKLLRDTCMIRREKTEVLKDLPEKTRTVIEMELPEPARKSYERAESDFIEWLQQQEGDEAARRAMQAETLVRIGKLRQLAARGRMVPTCEWIDDFIETGRKLVVFGWHKDVLYELGAKYGAPVITGDTPLEQRQEFVDRFQEDPETKILILGIRAGGVGLTLTAASDVLFVETGWTAGEMDQAEDRCHRIGQKNNVACYYAFAPGTIDEYLMDLVEEKRNIYRRTMGEENKVKRSKGKIGEVLLGIVLKNQMEKIKND